jgi:hypothetical protein
MLSLARIRWAVGSAVLLLILAGGAGDAIAQDDGVHVDPKTPAGKEYALPLDSARRDAAGGADTGSTSGAAPLFGAGISRRDAQGTGKGGQKRSANGTEDNGAATDGETSSSKTVAAAVAKNGTGLSGGLLTGLIALGVLLIGGIVGLSLRALRATDHPG